MWIMSTLILLAIGCGDTGDDDDSGEVDTGPSCDPMTSGED